MKYIAYYRVSTKKQGASGLGLEAQKMQVHNFTKGCTDCILAEFTEIESGKVDDRTELTKAMAAAKAAGAVLLIAKLDRLSRNAGFIFALRDSGIDFVCADMPEANTLTIGIFAVMAQHEREIISSRTKAGLQAAKARGTQLGKPANLTAEARKKAVKARTTKAKAGNMQAAELIKLYRAAGLTYRAIVDKLNASGYKTNRGNAWALSSVKVLDARTIEI